MRDAWRECAEKVSVALRGMGSTGEQRGGTEEVDTRRHCERERITEVSTQSVDGDSVVHVASRDLQRKGWRLIEAEARQQICDHMEQRSLVFAPGGMESCFDEVGVLTSV